MRNVYHINMRILIFCIQALFTIGCQMHNRYEPLNIDNVNIIGDKLFVNDQLFAELRYYFTEKSSDYPTHAFPFHSSVQHRGLAIYYCQQNKLVWIFPKGGLESNINKHGFYTAHGDGEGKLSWIFDVSITPDARFVLFKKPGLFGVSSEKYLIEYRDSE